MQTHGLGRRLDVVCRVRAAQAEAWGRIHTPESCVAVCAWNLSPGEARQEGSWNDRWPGQPGPVSPTFTGTHGLKNKVETPKQDTNSEI